MRYTSIRLYGELCSKTKDFDIEVDISLHHNNMVTFLLHLCENDPNIVKVSIKKTDFIYLNVLLYN